MTKDQLSEYKWVKKNIAELEDRLLEHETAAMRTTSRISADPKSTTIDYGYATAVARIIETKDMINLKLQLLYKLEYRIESAFDNLPQREQVLMRLRYINDKPWQYIADYMSYSIEQIHRIHGNALERLKDYDI